ncbi:tRNA (adenosine(37)-N6)-dimethylallyltransferase MiaA [Nodularia spumigena CS-584]|jgi:tRNA dimethylallyltransferase|uniref:tRNA dimethylallyltransferase n=1 Tax=Nodularia spumigena UHCC 0060 TaxID=3110300 RepID=A0ABU5UNR6_NODSP|nr:tRNA (adenosine(37)-N6)-dimethylallyltransferase MiaA [Nodularia spumigena]AHJ31189.1 tRNA delta(2)-isopentenylpyrophosphate transferase [Nodularia spumigena CCY9414]EAW43976.1 tRNA delta(2)-isopentenylpyrophosphate transferase [Nodularia spumigena CCY9414]MDB9383862.1 tRNA (adenosine(37)-N6)-dimethylallyltransferase MiaA [Nodularia spumigena CS-584]MEA5524281.1 tRNA (adenosine(37)-N6)-dimethylallyltransferase MiaA [Nodularia spumigena UHCC 0143]MEA5607245.1 tRNA (adenosine(37)-N6)-dimethyl
MTKLIVICGATATGKSGLALNLAMRLNSVILSADSRQVYREFDIGTAKPTLAERKLVPHYLIDICNPTDIMTVADYQEQAQRLITELPGAPLLLVGGTGLYIRSIVQGMKIPRVAPDQELRSQLQSLGQTTLYGILQQVDAIAAQKIHPHDNVRTLRALEVFYITGRPISQQQGENPPDYPILQIGLDCEVEKIRLRIHNRTEQMLADGLVAEVEYLCQKYGADLPLLNTLGYQEIRQYLAGEISLDSAKELTVLHTRQFAKRQRTWFKSSPQIEWFDADDPDLLDNVWRRVQEFINNV